MDTNFPIITDRLIIRPISPDDSESIFAYRRDRLVNQYQGWIPENLEDTKAFILHKVSSVIDVPGTWFQFALIEKNQNRLIGDIGIHFLNSPDNLQAEIGCTLDKNHHKMGYATEALTVIVDFLFNRLNKHRIMASIDPRNEKSIRLVERLGFRQEGHFRKSLLINNEWVDDLVFAILKEEWNPRQREAGCGGIR